MAQSVEIDVRIGDDQLTKRLKEQIRLAEELKRALGGAGQAGAPAPSGAGQAGLYYDARGRLRDQSGRYAAAGTQPPPNVTQPAGAQPAGAPPAGAQQAGNRTAAAVANFMTQTTAGGLLSSTGSAVSNVPFIGGAMGAYLGIKGTSLQMREGLATQAAGLEQVEGRMRGAIDTGDAQLLGEELTRELQPLGFGPQEARALMLQAATSFGRGVSGEQLKAQALELGAAERAGVPAAMIAQLAGALTDAGAGDFDATTQLTKEIRNLAEQGLDLRGAGVQTFLSGVSSMVTSMSAQGLSVNPRRLADTMRGISTATGRQGQRPLQITQALTGAAGGARAGLAAQFGGLVQNALQAEAFNRASSPLEALAELERIQQDPAQVQEILRQTYGTEGAALGLASISGIGTRDAASLAGAPSIRQAGTESARLTAAELAAGLTISAAQAQSQATIIDKTRTEDGTAAAIQLIQTSETLKEAVLKLTDNAQALQALTSGLAKALNYAAAWVP